MKIKLSILYLLFSISISSFSQIEKPIKKGIVLLGGQFEAGSIKENNTLYSSKYLSFSPNIGFFVKDNLALGITVPLSYSQYGNNDGTFRYGLGPYAKYYWDSGFFISLHSVYRNNPDTYSDFTISPGLGYAFFINPWVSIESNLNYKYVKYSNSTSHSGFIFKVGFQYFW